MEFDIRDNAVQDPKVVRFADVMDSGEYGQADIISKNNGEVRICESNNSDYVRLNSKQHALDLIKALEFAVAKEWFIN